MPMGTHVHHLLMRHQFCSPLRTVPSLALGVARTALRIFPLSPRRFPVLSRKYIGLHTTRIEPAPVRLLHEDFSVMIKKPFQIC